MYGKDEESPGFHSIRATVLALGCQGQLAGPCPTLHTGEQVASGTRCCGVEGGSAPPTRLRLRGKGESEIVVSGRVVKCTNVKYFDLDDRSVMSAMQPAAY